MIFGVILSNFCIAALVKDAAQLQKTRKRDAETPPEHRFAAHVSRETAKATSHWRKEQERREGES